MTDASDTAIFTEERLVYYTLPLTHKPCPPLSRVLTHPRRYRILRLLAPVQERLNDWTVIVQPARGLPQERRWKTMT